MSTMSSAWRVGMGGAGGDVTLSSRRPCRSQSAYENTLANTKDSRHTDLLGAEKEPTNKTTAAKWQSVGLPST